ncbi:MAG: hypothetical protein KDC26_05180 [Armatimonadetes bacterium]|nr:hypothetical protein [Armatimonadota bacterium]
MKKLTVLAALGVAAISSAQGNLLEEPTNIAFRLGYVYPVDATMRNISPSYLGIGIDIYPEGFNLMSEGESYISIDWFGKSGSGAKGNAFPVMINNKVYSDSGYGRSYFFYGLGVVFADLTNSDVVLGARAGYGKELGENLFGELSFTYSDSAGGARATALGFHLGYRF